jgi:hypothetical protein
MLLNRSHPVQHWRAHLEVEHSNQSGMRPTGAPSESDRKEHGWSKPSNTGDRWVSLSIICRCTDKRRFLSVTAWKSRRRPCVQCADLLNPLYRSLKEVLFQPKVIGTDDTSVKVLDITLPLARTRRLESEPGRRAAALS